MQRLLKTFTWIYNDLHMRRYIRRKKGVIYCDEYLIHHIETHIDVSLLISFPHHVLPKEHSRFPFRIIPVNIPEFPFRIIPVKSSTDQSQTSNVCRCSPLLKELKCNDVHYQGDPMPFSA